MRCATDSRLPVRPGVTMPGLPGVKLDLWLTWPLVPGTTSCQSRASPCRSVLHKHQHPRRLIAD
eukprot:170135-Rhodomonas_salina.2